MGPFDTDELKKLRVPGADNGTAPSPEMIGDPITQPMQGGGSTRYLSVAQPAGPIAAPRVQAGPPPIQVPANVQRDQAEVSRLQTTGSGVDQFRKMHPIAGGILKGLQIAGSLALPGLTARIPGTDLHHQVLENQAQGQLATDIKQNQSEAQAEEAAAKPALTQAETQHTQAETNAITHPEDKEPTNAFELWHQQNPQGTYQDWQKLQPESKGAIQHIATDQGYFAIHPDGRVEQLTFNGKPLAPVAKEANRDDKAIAIMSKPETEWTPEEKSYMQGYNQYVQKNKVEPGVARLNVLGGFGMEVADPDHPGQTIIVPRNEASGRAGKGSASVTVPRKEAEYMTSGPGGKQLTAFNTAIEHLKTLDRLAGDLHNSDVKVFNRAAQAWSEQTGNPSPANFAAAKNAMAGEVASALKASGATDQEITSVSATFDRAQSPAQLKGAINTYRELLGSKRDQLKAQHNFAQQGQPNFGGEQSGKPTHKFNPATGKIEPI